MESYPKEIRQFLGEIQRLDSSLNPQVESGGKKAGNWWVDFTGPVPLTVEWRRDIGFGISHHQPDSFGEGPDEIFRTPERAAHRVVQLQINTQPMIFSLRAIRELYGKTQSEMAQLLGIQQAAISKLETRENANVETLGDYLHALGGHLEIRAVFPDAQVPIFTSADPSKSSSNTEPCRA